MSTQKFVYTVLNNFGKNTAAAGLSLNGTVKATATAENLKLDREALGLSIMSEVGKFKMALDSGAMMVKSPTTGEVKTVNIGHGVMLKNALSLSNFIIYDDRVRPTHDFSRADPGMVNIHMQQNQGGAIAADDGVSTGAL